VIDANTIIARNPRVVHRNLAGQEGAVLLHLDTSAYHGVNPVGSLIWAQLAEPVSFEHLVVAVRGSLQDAPPELARDVAAFIAELQARDLVRLEPQP
jgi:Coenzyme PQQ synthesis protein D (PqqD)